MRIVLTLLISLISISSFAAYITNQKMTIDQPDGSFFDCYASGDEFFNYLHDGEGFTIIQNPNDGFYYYAIKNGDKIVPSVYIPGRDNPVIAGLTKNILIDRVDYMERRQNKLLRFDREQRVPTTGVVNNLVVYIRFSDQEEFQEPRSLFDTRFNSMEPSDISMYNYYQEVSYQTLEIFSYHYPVCEMNVNLSYQDIYPRNYYCQYNAVTNPDGYHNGDESTYREHQLLARAVNFIENEISLDLNIDVDDDNYVDNVCFIICGGNEGWAELLWAHRWVLYSEDVYIHGKRVYDYTFQPVSQNSVGTLCHEMFHVLGAPDLYRYTSSEGYTNPMGEWDLMAGGSAHMSAYMKYRYGHWIDDIPEVNFSGEFWIKSLMHNQNNVCKIASPASDDEYFLLEFRKRTGLYESTLPGSGIIITRVNTLYDGEGNAQGPPDELYLFRPGGNLDSDGNTSQAFFSLESGRTAFNEDTDPYPFLDNGAPGGISVVQIGTSVNDSISFLFDPQLGFLNLSVTTDNPDTDLSQINIAVGQETYHPNELGALFLAVYQGSYQIEASLNGYSSQIINIVIQPNIDNYVNLDLAYLVTPENLQFEYLDDNQVRLYWEFANISDDHFEEFAISLSLNDVTYSDFFHTTNLEHSLTLNPNYEYFFKIKAEYDYGVSLPSNTIQIDLSSAEDSDIIKKNELLGNYPNPFIRSANSRGLGTTVSFLMAEKGKASVEIYNLKGQKIVELQMKDVNPGEHTIDWNMRDSDNELVGSGVYLYRLIINDNEIDTGRMLLLK